MRRTVLLLLATCCPAAFGQIADLSITKTDGVTTYTPGGTTTYTIVVSNLGPSNVVNAPVTDSLPAAITSATWTCVAAAGSSCGAANGVGSFATTASLLSGGSATYTVTANISASATGNLVNTATVSTPAGVTDPNPGNNSSTDTDTALPLLADLSITKSHAGSFVQGQIGATYTLTPRNLGPGPTTGAVVTVTDTLPASLTATAISGSGWTCTLVPLSCTTTAIVPAATNFNVITVNVNVAANAPSNVINTAVVAGGGELNAANNAFDDLTIIIQLPDLTMTKTHVGNFTQGQLGATYNLTVNNSGFGPTTGAIVTVTDTLPPGLTAVAMAGPGWTCTVATVSCTSTAVVATGASFPPITLAVNVATNSPLNVNNFVTVAGGGELAVNNGNNSANDPTTILPLDFLIRYAANLTSGDSVINITNTGFNGASLNGPGFGGAAGNICMNVYAFSPDEQLVSCCSCLITPNGLVSLSANNDLISNTLTGVRPNSIVVKLVATAAGATFTGTSCANSAALAGTPAFPTASGTSAFGTTVHAHQGTGFATTETPFLSATLSPAELTSITNRCTNIIGNGSTFGICRSCRAGGLGGDR